MTDSAYAGFAILPRLQSISTGREFANSIRTFLRQDAEVPHVTASGLRLEYAAEPRPTDEVARDCPVVQDAQVVAYFLHIRARKLA